MPAMTPMWENRLASINGHIYLTPVPPGGFLCSCYVPKPEVGPHYEWISDHSFVERLIHTCNNILEELKLRTLVQAWCCSSVTTRHAQGPESSPRAVGASTRSVHIETYCRNGRAHKIPHFNHRSDGLDFCS